MVYSSIQLYGPSLALLTDLYELTMAYGYWKTGAADWQGVFHLEFRKNPFGGSFAVACGLHSVIDYLERFRFETSDLEYLASLKGNDSKPLFDTKFLEYLETMRFSGDLDAVPEGTVVRAHEPLLRVMGPLPQVQLLETALLNLLNFQTLIATKAMRVCLAAEGDPVLEFGLRRAHGIDGGVTGTRAAYVGGCSATSNVLAGKLFGIPVRGTVAHSWIMTFLDEKEAFRRYAEAVPNNVVLLVDTYDSVQGVQHAIEVGKWLREQGYRLVGVRLDSGDLATLARKARQLLDEAGFPETAVVASGDLDEYAILDLKRKGAPIAMWGVGTKLAVAYDQPALGGVYKLSAIRRPSGSWEPRVKLSEEAAKASQPGILQVRRYRKDAYFWADVLYDVREGSPTEPITDWEHGQPWSLENVESVEDLLVPVFRRGKRCFEPPSLDSVRLRARTQVQQLPPQVRHITAPEPYPLGVSQFLRQERQRALAALSRSTP
jgi:nicotinate phosphoribosyltransferase